MQRKISYGIEKPIIQNIIIACCKKTCGSWLSQHLQSIIMLIINWEYILQEISIGYSYT